MDENGIEKKSQPELVNILTNLYKDLFSKDPLDMQVQTDIIEDLSFSLTDFERNLCESPFTATELSAALEGLRTGKSPGSDSLPR